MYYPYLIIGELLVLFFLSRVLTRSLSYLFHSMTNSSSGTVYFIAFLFLPGTALHEIAHYVMAHILFVQTGKTSLLPKLDGNMLKLGSVEVASTDPFRRMLIGVAPFIIGTSILLGMFFYLTPRIHTLPLWGIVVAFLIIFQIGNTMFSSRKDLEGTIVFLVILISIITAGYLLGIRIPDQIVSFVTSPKFLEQTKQIAMYFSFPLGIDILIIGIIKIITRSLKY